MNTPLTKEQVAERFERMVRQFLSSSDIHERHKLTARIAWHCIEHRDHFMDILGRAWPVKGWEVSAPDGESQYLAAETGFVVRTVVDRPSAVPLP